MEQLRPVSKTEKNACSRLSLQSLLHSIVPDAVSLVGMLMLGNLIKESGVADRSVQRLLKTV